MKKITKTNKLRSGRQGVVNVLRAIDIKRQMEGQRITLGKNKEVLVSDAAKLAELIAEKLGGHIDLREINITEKEMRAKDIIEPGKLLGLLKLWMKQGGMPPTYIEQQLLFQIKKALNKVH